MVEKVVFKIISFFLFLVQKWGHCDPAHAEGVGIVIARQVFATIKHVVSVVTMVVSAYQQSRLSVLSSDWLSWTVSGKNRKLLMSGRACKRRGGVGVRARPHIFTHIHMHTQAPVVHHSLDMLQKNAHV